MTSRFNSLQEVFEKVEAHDHNEETEEKDGKVNEELTNYELTITPLQGIKLGIGKSVGFARGAGF